jgi:hypothetical protein
MIRGSCHCGAVRFELAEHRDFLTDCNCSICRRYAALWLHCQKPEVKFECAPDATLAYEWGDHLLAFHSCRTCGCTTHWSSTQDADPDTMAVNCRLAEPEDIADMRVRRFDGANTWQYLD